MMLKPLPAGSALPGVTGLVDGLRRIFADLDDCVTVYELPVKRLLAEWAKGHHHQLPTPMRLLLSVVFTAGVVSQDQLGLLLKALDAAVRTASGVWVHWTDQDWPDARVLSEFTVVEYGRLQGPIKWEHELDEFDHWLLDETPLGVTTLPRGKRRALQALLRGALAYLQRLPGALFAHIAKCQLLTSVSPSTLAREASGMALDIQSSNDETGAAEGARSQLDEASFRASVSSDSGIDTSESQRLWDIMVPTSNGGYATDRNSRWARIAEVFESTDSLDVEGNLRIGFSLFMLTVGTPGARRPSMVTCGRHYRSMEAAVRSLPGGFAELARMPDEQKVETYLAWLQADAADPYLSAAIGAFHMFLVEQLGAAPVWVRGKSVTIKVPPLASIVWLHERKQALDGIALSGSTDRVKLMARTLLLLACDVPLRISDVRRMKWRDVRPVGDKLFIDIVEHRDAASAKNKGTLRTVRVNGKAAHEALAAWMEQREDEDAEDPEWLFGDGFEPTEQIELGKAYALVCTLLKQVTGDPTVSFHTLRHTCITELMLDAFLNAPDDKEWDPLEPVAARAGHATAYSTLTAYFHLLPLVLRQQIDQLLAAQVTTRLIARTCGLPENTLTQRKKRHPNGDEPAKALRSAAQKVVIAEASTVVALRAVVLSSAAQRGPRVAELLKIVTDLDTSQDLNATTRRSGLPPDLIRDISRIRNRARMIFPGRIKRKSWKHSKKVLRVLRHVDRTADAPATREALGAWLHTMEKGYVDATDLRVVEPLLRLFQGIGTSHSMLVLRVANADSIELQQIQSLFITVFGHAPVVEVARRRGDRAENYFLLNSSPVGAEETAASASAAMKGLHAIFTALYVWHALAGTALPGVAI